MDQANRLNKDLAQSQDKSLSAKRDEITERGLKIANSIQIENKHVFSEDEYREFMERFNSLQRLIGEIPKEFTDQGIINPHKAKGAFEVNQYFQVFDRLTMQPGFVLDYIYLYDHHGGEPHLYARRQNELPIDKKEDYFARYSIKKPDLLLGNDPGSERRRLYLDHISFENSFIGYFQFALFCINAHRFYLNWHSNYNARSVILTRRGVVAYTQNNSVLGIGPEKRRAALELDHRPVVEIENNIGKVKFLCFDPWGYGLYWLNVRLSWPNSLIDKEEKTIIEGSSFLF